MARLAARVALVNMTEGIALHCGEKVLPIRCNAIYPGVVEPHRCAAISIDLKDEAALAAITGKQILDRLGGFVGKVAASAATS